MGIFKKKLLSSDFNDSRFEGGTMYAAVVVIVVGVVVTIVVVVAILTSRVDVR